MVKKINAAGPENFIKELRTGLDLSQAEFGRLLGVSDATVNRWEKLINIEPRYLTKIDMLRAVEDLVTSDVVDVDYIKILSKKDNYNIDLIYLKLVQEKIIKPVPFNIDPEHLFEASPSKLVLLPVNLIKKIKDDNETERITKLIKRQPESINLVDDKGVSALMVAAGHGYKRIVEMLIKAGADINYVCKNSTDPITEKFMTKRTNKDWKSWGDTALHRALMGRESELAATMNQKTEIIKRLLKSNADPNAVAQLGQTPLLLAVINNFPTEILQLLIDRGADVNAQNDLDQGRTPLMAALTHKKFAQLNFLLKAKANLDLQDVTGQTILHYAVSTGLTELAETLISLGANTNIADEQDLTPLEFAKEIKSPVFKYLEELSSGENGNHKQ